MRARARITMLIGAASVMAMVTFLAAAQQSPPEEHVQAMQAVGAASQTFRQFGDSQDYAAVSASAESAATALEYVRDYWKDRDGAAAELADKAWKAARDVRVAADLASGEGVEYAVGEVMSTCMPCHSEHRERLDDGSFMIK